MDYYDKDEMPLTATMSANKQKLFLKVHDTYEPDEYTRWEERQHYNLTNNKWVGTYAGTDSGDDKVTIKINTDGSVSYTESDEDNGVGKATGYWINDNNRIHVYLTHFNNMNGIDESNMPLIITMSNNQNRISVASHSSDWIIDHYHRK